VGRQLSDGGGELVTVTLVPFSQIGAQVLEKNLTFTKYCPGAIGDITTVFGGEV